MTRDKSQLTYSILIHLLFCFAFIEASAGQEIQESNEEGSTITQTPQPTKISPQNEGAFDFSRISNFESLPEKINAKIKTDFDRKYRRLLLSLHDNNQITELELLPYQQTEIARQVLRFQQYEESSNAEIKRGLKQFNPTKVDPNDPAWVEFEAFAMESKKQLFEQYKTIQADIEKVLVDRQVRMIKARANAYALDVNLPKNIPPFVRAVFMAESLGLSDEKIEELRLLAAEEIREMNEAIRESEQKAIKSIISKYPKDLQSMVMEAYGIERKPNSKK